MSEFNIKCAYCAEPIDEDGYQDSDVPAAGPGPIFHDADSCRNRMGLRVRALESDLAAAKKSYVDLADAICRESTGVEDACDQARATRARAERAERDVEALNKFFLTGAEYSLDEVLRFLRGEGPDPLHKTCAAKLADRDATIRKAWTAIALDNDTAAALEVLAPAPTPHTCSGDERQSECAACREVRAVEPAPTPGPERVCVGANEDGVAFYRESGDAKGEAPK